MEGYEALRRSAAWRDLSARGRLRATGADRARLLHAITSNVVEARAPGRGVYAFFLDAQGHIQADSHIFVAPDHILIDCEPESTSGLQEHIESYIIMDDVSIENITDETALLAVVGPMARRVAAALCDRLPEETLSFVEVGNLRVYRAPLAETDGYWIAAAASDKRMLVDTLEAQGAVSADEDAFEANRVQHRIPRFGVDFGPKNIPHETQQLHAVSFTKGCYTGQEIVERVRSRGQVKRLLVGIELESAAVPEVLTVRHNGKPVGALTSPTPGSPPDGRACGFAIVRSLAAAPGTAVQVGGTPGRTADVARQ